VAQGKDGEEELKPSDSEPLAAYVWKTTADPFVGKMTYFRVFFKVPSKPMLMCGIKTKARMSVCRFALPARQGSIAAKVIHAGDIAVVSKLNVTATGDTPSAKRDIRSRLPSPPNSPPRCIAWRLLRRPGRCSEDLADLTSCAKKI
jgi:elongation factor G